MPQLPTELLNSVGVALEIVVALLTAFLVAFWVSLAIWTFRDMHARTRDIFAWVLATVLVLVTGPIGLMFYLLLRPRETLAEAYDRQLEEEALLRDITTRRACPSCQMVTEPEWLVCPHCRAELRRKCIECSRPLELDWVICPYCTAPVPEQAFGQIPEQVPERGMLGGLVPAFRRQPVWAPEAEPTMQGQPTSAGNVAGES